MRRRVRKFLLFIASSCIAQIAAAQSIPMLIQAESMTLTAPMVGGYDIGAMGGRFISVPSGSNATNPTPLASVQVTNVPAGTYYLWARIAGPTITNDALYVGIGSSFARVAPPGTGPYAWVRIPTTDGGTNYAFSLGGNHTIQAGYGEVGAKLDALYLTNNATEVPSFTAPARVLIEAEAMTLEPNSQMSVVTDASASGGRYLTTSAPNTTTPPRRASVPVHMPAGTYYLWARVGGTTINNDAMYVGIDSSFSRTFPEPTQLFQWVRVKISQGSTAVAFVFSQPGVHVIQVGEGETNARIDAVYLTTDSAEVPGVTALRRRIEAESLTLEPVNPPMTAGSDPDASGGQFLAATTGTSPTTRIRAAWTTIDVPAGGGTFYLWARVKGLSATSDAVYAGFDNAWDRVFPVAFGAYEWIRVENGDGSGAYGTVLSAGQHVVQVGVGEIGARIDELYVTDSETDSPTGPTTPPGGGGGGTTARCALPTGQYAYQGFGAAARGGLDANGVPLRIVEVTNLNDTGTGSLREALSGGDRCIVFKLSAGGTINLTSKLSVRSNVTIDGFTAVAPGITLVNNQAPGPDENDDPPALDIASINNVTQTNIIVRGIRVRKAPGDGIRVLNASNVVIDRVSVTGYRDGAIDVTGERTRNVTIQWSILGQGQNTDGTTSKINLNALRAALVTVHHNLYINGDDRQPFCSYFDNATAIPQSPNPNPLLDARNNLIWNHLTGAKLADGCSANLVRNYYHSSRTSTGRSISIRPEDVVSVFISENVRGGSTENINSPNNRSSAWPLSLPAPTTTDARTAARAIIDRTAGAGAGARNLPAWDYDAMDDGFIDNIESVGIQ